MFYQYLIPCILNVIQKTTEMFKIVKSFILKKYKYHIGIGSRKKPCQKCMLKSFKIVSESNEEDKFNLVGAKDYCPCCLMVIGMVQSYKPKRKQEILNPRNQLKRGQSQLNFKFWIILLSIPISPVHCKPVNQNSHDDINSFSFGSLSLTQQIILIFVILLLPILALLVFRIIILGKHM